jgi:hypothetical protein
MTTISYADFNQNSKYYLEAVAQKNEEIIILKNKKPTFKISLLFSKSFKNLLKDSIVFEEDIISPLQP